MATKSPSKQIMDTEPNWVEVVHNWTLEISYEALSARLFADLQEYGNWQNASHVETNNDVGNSAVTFTSRSSAQWVTVNLVDTSHEPDIAVRWGPINPANGSKGDSYISVSLKPIVDDELKRLFAFAVFGSSQKPKLLHTWQVSRRILQYVLFGWPTSLLE